MTTSLIPGTNKAMLTVAAVTANGQPAPLPATPGWSSSDTTVLTVEPDPADPTRAVATPVASGTAQALVTSGELSASVDFSVEVPVPVAVSLVVDVQVVPQ